MRRNPLKQVLIGLKKKGFGALKYNGFGGKIRKGEAIKEAALRELLEEAGVEAAAEDVSKVGELTFVFPSVPQDGLPEEKQWNQVVHVFLVHAWRGKPVETKEMKPAWFDFDKIPFDEMWQDDRHWLPLVLEGKKVKATFVFDKDNESIARMDLKELADFQQ